MAEFMVMEEDEVILWLHLLDTEWTATCSRWLIWLLHTSALMVLLCFSLIYLESFSCSSRGLCSWGQIWVFTLQISEQRRRRPLVQVEDSSALSSAGWMVKEQFGGLCVQMSQQSFLTTDHLLDESNWDSVLVRVSPCVFGFSITGASRPGPPLLQVQ